MVDLCVNRGVGAMHISINPTAMSKSHIDAAKYLSPHAFSYPPTPSTPGSCLSDLSDVSNCSSTTADSTPPASPRHGHTSKILRQGSKPVSIFLGTATFGDSRAACAKVSDPSTVSSIVSKLLSRSHFGIDTARAYPIGRGGSAEKLLGQLPTETRNQVSISTKVSSFLPGSHRPENIARSIDSSLSSLGVSQVDILYLHAPDSATSLVDTCRAMHQAYTAGKFRRFGLSNYTRDQVILILLICDRYGFVRPTVYQGMYNPLCRDVEELDSECQSSSDEDDDSDYFHSISRSTPTSTIPSPQILTPSSGIPNNNEEAEESLLDLLRRENISFHAYSPTAAGFFLPITTPHSYTFPTSRFNPHTPLGSTYHRSYFHPSLFQAASTVRSVASRYGITGHEAALRWTVWHSCLDADVGDAVVVGASSERQLEENLAGIERGPLPDEVRAVVEGLWGCEEVVRGARRGGGVPRCRAF